MLKMVLAKNGAVIVILTLFYFYPQTVGTMYVLIAEFKVVEISVVNVFRGGFYIHA